MPKRAGEVGPRVALQQDKTDLNRSWTGKNGGPRPNQTLG